MEVVAVVLVVVVIVVVAGGRSPTKLDEPFHLAAGSVQAPYFF